MVKTNVELLCAKRDGHRLTPEEIQRFVADYMAGAVADYQMAAFLMAVFFRGLDEIETVALTEAMLHSGRVLDLSNVPGLKIDKHSTGGVGDKVSICLAPLVAACGVPVPMVSGRGLGHTGGTLDKLEAIPGFRTALSTDDFVRILSDVGTCLIGQTAEIAPADKRIYALRDVTGTVEHISLIVASILSKKLAEGIDGLVLDVKVGQGAFMKDLAAAEELARALVRVGTRAGKRVKARLTDMESPLGNAVGNALETREALDVLHGRGPADLVECTYLLGADMLVLGGKARDTEEARGLLARAISSGDAVRVMERVVAAQGGDPRVVADPSRLEIATEVAEVKAPRDAYVVDVDAFEIGLASVAMGAGRSRADQAIDPAIGVVIDAKPGAKVKAGDVLARVYVRPGKPARPTVARVLGAYVLGDEAPEARALLRATIEGEG